MLWSAVVLLAMASCIADPGWRPPPQELPPEDPGLRERLGEYAEFVLGDSALVTRGSPEHERYLATCYESAGYDVVLTDGGIQMEVDDREALYEVRAQCEAAAVDIGLVKAVEPPSERELAAWYEAFTLTYECMVEHGIAVSEPPPLAEYVESEGMLWHPYQGMRGDPSGVESLCPQDVVILFEMLAAGEEP